MSCTTFFWYFYSVIDILTFTLAVPELGGGGEQGALGWVTKNDPRSHSVIFLLWKEKMPRTYLLRYQEKRREQKMTRRAVLKSEIANLLKREDNMSNSSGTRGLKEVAVGLKSSNSFHSNEGNSDPFNIYTILYFTIKSMSSHLSCCPGIFLRV